VAVAAPKTAPTAPLRDGWHRPADQNRACGAVWIALGAVLAIVVAPCFSHPSVESMCLGIACLYSGRSSIRLGVEQLRAGRRVSVDRGTAPGTRLIAGDEIEPSRSARTASTSAWRRRAASTSAWLPRPSSWSRAVAR
jgi:hypothetical protein